MLTKKDKSLLIGSLCATVLVVALPHFPFSTLVGSFLSAVSLVLISQELGKATDELGEWLGAQFASLISALIGNVPEVIFGIFALHAGLTEVVEAAVAGSIIGNLLLVLGMALLCGGLRHGFQQLNSHDTDAVRNIVTPMRLMLVALAIPAGLQVMHAKASSHMWQISLFSSIMLLVLFAFSTRFFLRYGSEGSLDSEKDSEISRWPLWLILIVMLIATVEAVLVSNRFVGELSAMISQFHLSPIFIGVILVSVAGNVVEHAVAVRYAMRNRLDMAIYIPLQSALQVGVFLYPLLVLLSLWQGSAVLVMPILLVVSIGTAQMVATYTVEDGRTNPLEGLVLLVLYAVMAAIFFWS